MRATTVCVCFTILVSFALTIVGFPENSVRDDGEAISENQLTVVNTTALNTTALNITTPAAIEEKSAIPIYNPAMAFGREKNHRVKRHLFHKKGKGGGGGGYQIQQQPPVIIINHYQQPAPKVCDTCQQPIQRPIQQPIQPKPVYVQNTGWGGGGCDTCHQPIQQPIQPKPVYVQVQNTGWGGGGCDTCQQPIQQPIQQPKPPVQVQNTGWGYDGGHTKGCNSCNSKGYDGGQHIQPRQPVHVQNPGWGWKK